MRGLNMATIREIAKACDVSIATVSNILNHKGKVSEKTRQMVLEQVERMNYVPNVVARNLKCRETRMIGIITEDLTVFNAPEIVDGIDDYLEEQDYNFVLGNLRIYKKYGNDFSYHEEFKKHLDEEIAMMRAKQVEGIIYVSAHSRDLSEMLEQDANVPIVVVYGFADKKEIPSIVFDDEKAADAVVSCLLKDKAVSLGIIAGEKNSVHTIDRLLGCQKALFRSGVLFNPELVYYGDWSRKFGYEAAEQLLGKHVNVIFSMNDSMAAGVYDYARDQNLTIGKDIFIGGIGNKIGDVLRPRLTTVEMPLFEMGRRAGEQILELISGQKMSCEKSKLKGTLQNEKGGSA